MLRSLPGILSILFSILSPGTVSAQTTVDLKASDEFLQLGKYLSILEDKTASLSLEDVRRTEYDTVFRSSKTEIINFNVSKSAFWCRFKLHNLSDISQWHLEQMLGSMSSTECYLLQSGKISYEKKSYLQPAYERKPSAVYPTFLVTIPKDSSCLVYVRLTDVAPFSANLNIGKPEYFAKRNHTYDILNGFYIGMMFILMLSNLFIYFSVKERTYIYYVFYILFATLFISMLNGYAAYLPSALIAFTGDHQAILGSLFGLFATLFTINFLNLKKNAPKLLKLNYVLTGLLFIAAGVQLAGFKHESLLLIQCLGLCLSITSILSGYTVLKGGYKPAKYYLIAWGTYMACMISYILKDLNLLPYNMLTQNALQAGSMFEAILLSIALADKVSSFKEDKEAAQEKALLAAKENEKLIREQNAMLELKVKERTAEIESQKKIIEERQKDILDSIHYAKRIQKSLLPSEKFIERQMKK
jgi:hypothetical protein